ncbi:Retrovirus-related Pol polyprotein from transposon TNT 1-94 [Gossypium australe]|uniref:Retrovirus-related Pol polyprotein from transposon TNT 1-94 n=1 Tax=Gossypium australe TaxID=47621 RepID=A0A5B6VCI4_9ROSI|nr:Retrovirus-related Pol polyprotein from transposon TNT 1-94 [Gossypium australe]
MHTDICGPMKTSLPNGSSTRFYWVYFMKNKSEVAKIFFKFKAMVENQSVCKLKMNGVSERKNSTIMNMARCLLFESKLPNDFWAEVVNTIVYLLNRLPIKSIWLHLFCSCSRREKKQLDSRSQPRYLLDILIIYNLFTKKVIKSRGVKFEEGKIWNWSATEEEMCEQEGPKLDLRATRDQTKNDVVDEQLVRQIRSITKIYQRCNLVKLEPTTFEEAAQEVEWRTTMKDKITMINKNET